MMMFCFKLLITIRLQNFCQFSILLSEQLKLIAAYPDLPAAAAKHQTYLFILRGHGGSCSLEIPRRDQLWRTRWPLSTLQIQFSSEFLSTKANFVVCYFKVKYFESKKQIFPFWGMGILKLYLELKPNPQLLLPQFPQIQFQFNQIAIANLNSDYHSNYIESITNSNIWCVRNHNASSFSTKMFNELFCLQIISIKLSQFNQYFPHFKSRAGSVGWL